VSVRAIVPAAVLAVACAVLWWAPTAESKVDDGVETLSARVVSVDNKALVLTGALEYGTQVLEVELLEGECAGRRFRAENEIRAQLDIDKKFAPGDIAAVVWPDGGANVGDTLVARDHWRLGWMWALLGMFTLMLIAFGGWTGAKALFSFFFSCLAVWKLLVPLCLAGHSAAWVSFATVCVLTAVIMYLVAGATRKGIAAFAGSMLGIGAWLALAEFFAKVMHVDGSTMPYAQALIYSGGVPLNLSDVFTGSVILASSGAVMDLAMDIASGIEELHRHNPALPRRELFFSAVRIGRSVVGTMTTTLLLAYSGGYLTLLMVFAAQGTPPEVFLNSTLVSAEVVKTLVGSFGLVLVAPFTALIGAWIFGAIGEVRNHLTKEG
jgi:uncharacterized membrane protein